MNGTIIIIISHSIAFSCIVTCTSVIFSSNQWRSQSFTVGRAQSGPLTALIGCLNVLLEYFDFFKF